MKLFIDDREKRGRQKWVQREYSHLDPVVKHLDYGDYHYVTDEGLTVVFEYKTGVDFLKSIRDGHLHNQVYEMCTHYDYTFIMVAVPNWDSLFKEMWYKYHVDYDMNDVMGAIARFNCNTTVIERKSRKEAFDMMLRQARKISEEQPLCYKFGKKERNSALNYLNSIYGMNVKTTSRIVNQLNLRTLQDLQDLTIEDLVSVDKIGRKKAETILENIGVKQ